MFYFFKLGFNFLLITFWEYWIHRLSHYKHKYNFLYNIHKLHHSWSYKVITEEDSFHLSYLFLWFDTLYETIEIWFMSFIPVLIAYYIDNETYPLLFFYYFYEIIATASLVEHNPRIKNENIIYYLAIGKFHLQHHKTTRYNYSFKITLWDYVFDTYFG